MLFNSVQPEIAEQNKQDLEKLYTEQSDRVAMEIMSQIWTNESNLQDAKKSLKTWTESAKRDLENLLVDLDRDDVDTYHVPGVVNDLARMNERVSEAQKALTSVHRLASTYIGAQR